MGTYTASAPGRLDVLGGVADYAGSLVLQLPIRERTTVELEWRGASDCVTVESHTAEGSLAASVKLSDLTDLRALDLPAWSRYVLGCWSIGASDGLFVARGARVTVRSEVPAGAGLSSSAALTVATWRVLAKAYALELAPVALARLAQRVEHEVVGAPCGLMDQLAVHCGTPGRLLPIVCRPDAVGAPIALPDALRLYAVESGVRHAVSGDAYGRARAASFMGLRVLRRDFGFAGGHLAEVAAAGFRESVLAQLPETVTGRDFLAGYGGVEDELSRINPDVDYPLRAATAHPIFEHERISAVAKTLRDAVELDAWGLAAKRTFGDALYAAHASYSEIGLGHAATDRIVAAVKGAGKTAGLYGARVTGGGSGGTVAVLGDERSGSAALARALRLPPGRVRRVHP